MKGIVSVPRTLTVHWGKSDGESLLFGPIRWVAVSTLLSYEHLPLPIHLNHWLFPTDSYQHQSPFPHGHESKHPVLIVRLPFLMNSRLLVFIVSLCRECSKHSNFKNRWRMYFPYFLLPQGMGVSFLKGPREKPRTAAKKGDLGLRTLHIIQDAGLNGEFKWPDPFIYFFLTFYFFIWERA